MSLIEEVRAARQLPTPRLARAIREAAGLSQQQVGEEVGVGKMSISRWESGVRRPSGDAGSRYLALLIELQHEVIPG